MPGKPRQKKSKHLHHSRKSKAIQRQATIGSIQTPINIPKPVVPVTPPPSPKEESIPAPAKAISYPYVTGELRRIGILAVIVLIILIILSVILT
jgi:hypothetical protein